MREPDLAIGAFFKVSTRIVVSSVAKMLTPQPPGGLRQPLASSSRNESDSMTRKRDYMASSAKIGLAFLVVGGIGSLVWLFLLKPFWLTQVHRNELEETILRYAEIEPSLEACLNPTLIDEVATGAALADRRDLRSGGRTCYVRELPGVRVLKVHEYSSTCTRVTAERWHLRIYDVDRTSLAVLTTTYHISATFTTPNPAYTDKVMYFLTRENADEKWKVAYTQGLSPYMRTHEWFEIPNCSNVPDAYPTD